MSLRLCNGEGRRHCERWGLRIIYIWCIYIYGGMTKAPGINTLFFGKKYQFLNKVFPFIEFF